MAGHPLPSRNWLLALQATAGNRAVAGLIAGSRAVAQRAASDQQPVRAGDLGTFGSPAETAFRRQIFEQQYQWALRQGKAAVWGVDEKDLGSLEGHPLRKDAVSAGGALLNQARGDLEVSKAKGNPKAMKVTRIGIASSYRAARTTDFDAWQTTFRSAYGTFYKQRVAEKRDSEPITSEETSAFLTHMINIKAVPGFSNHNRGTAIDFSTTEGGRTLGPDTGDAPAWRQSWLWNWLMSNAYTFGWDPYSKEEWHYDFTDLTPEEYRAIWCGTPQAG